MILKTEKAECRKNKGFYNFLLDNAVKVSYNLKRFDTNQLKG